MIRKWLLKHRWVNEVGKLITSGGFFYLAYLGWQGAYLISVELSDVVVPFKPLMACGMFVGIMAMIGCCILFDVVCSVVSMIRNRNAREAK